MFTIQVQGSSFKELTSRLRCLYEEMSMTDDSFAQPDLPVQQEVIQQVSSTSVKIEAKPEETLPPEVDASGAKWDAAIHSSSKKLTSDGLWRARRNVKQDEVASVTPVIPQSPVIVAPVPPPPLVTSPAVPLPPPPKGHTFDTFKANLIPVLAGLINEKKLTQDYVKSLCEYFEVKQLWEIMHNDMQIAELFANLSEAGLVTRVE